MSSYYYNPPAMHTNASFSVPGAQQQHSARPRRGARFNPAYAAPKSLKPARPVRESVEATQLAVLRRDFDAARSFDIDDDEIFCPWHLLTEDDLQSIQSSSSDHSSSSEASPDTSPMQAQTQPTPTFTLSATANPHMPASAQHPSGTQLKIHQPLAQRTRNAIPIVDPNSRHTSPPTSVSPARQAQKGSYGGRRW